MKKWSMRLCLAIMFLVMTVAAPWESMRLAAAGKTGTTTDGFSYEISAEDDTVTITGYSGKKKKLVIPDKIEGKKVTKIGEKAFSENKYMVSVKVPDSVKTVALDAFYQCRKLKTIELGKNVQAIGVDELKDRYCYYDDASDMCVGEKFEEFKVDSKNKIYYTRDGVLFRKTDKDIMLVRYPEGKKGKTYSVPEGVTCICLEGLYGSDFSTLTIPKTVRSIDGDDQWPDYTPFGMLEEYIVDEENENFFSEDGVLFERNEGGENDYWKRKGSILLQYPAEKKDTSYTVPEGVIHIREGAFYRQKYLESVTIPGTVIYIGEEAFFEMKNLKSADIGAATIGEGAFCTCENLTDVTLQNTVELISEKAFWVTGITSLVLPESVEKIEDTWMPSLEKIEIRNRDCELGVRPISYVNKTLILGYEGSTAETYAKKYGFSFQVIGETVSENPTVEARKITNETIQLSKETYIYDGKEKKPKVVVKDNYGNVINPSIYRVEYKNNKKVGEATVKIYMLDWKGKDIKKTFIIKPAKNRITKMTPTEKGFLAEWKCGGKPSQLDGYEIQYSTDKNFEADGTKKAVVKGGTTTKKSIKKLSSKKTYYVRIRSFKVLQKEGKSEKLYSKWSEIKEVTIQ